MKTFQDDLWLNPIQYFLVADGQEEENGVEGEEESSSDDNEESVEPENQSGTSSQGRYIRSKDYYINNYYCIDFLGNNTSLTGRAL